MCLIRFFLAAPSIRFSMPSDCYFPPSYKSHQHERPKNACNTRPPVPPRPHLLRPQYAHPVEPVYGAWPDLEPQQQPHAPTALWRQEEPLGGYGEIARSQRSSSQRCRTMSHFLEQQRSQPPSCPGMKRCSSPFWTRLSSLQPSRMSRRFGHRLTLVSSSKEPCAFWPNDCKPSVRFQWEAWFAVVTKDRLIISTYRRLYTPRTVVLQK